MQIHLFDENGYIYSGSLPLYYGYSFDSGEQIAYFKPMLTDRSLTMCQDVTPNTSEKKEMMYAITWNEAGSRMVQIGITPTRLLEEMRQNEISTVVDDMPVYEGMEILVADAKTRVVKGAHRQQPNRRHIGRAESASDQDHYDETAVFHVRIGKKSYRCLLCQDENYIVAVTVDNSFYLQSSLLAIFIVRNLSYAGILLYGLYAFKSPQGKIRKGKTDLYIKYRRTHEMSQPACL